MTTITDKELDKIPTEIEHSGLRYKEVVVEELKQFSNDLKKISDESAQKFKDSILADYSVPKLDLGFLDRPISIDVEHTQINTFINEQPRTIPSLPKEIYSKINQQDTHVHELNKIVGNMLESQESYN